MVNQKCSNCKRRKRDKSCPHDKATGDNDWCWDWRKK